MGIGDGVIPSILNQKIYDDICIITMMKPLDTARALASQEGIMCGISSGTNVAAALRLAKVLGPGKDCGDCASGHRRAVFFHPSVSGIISLPDEVSFVTVHSVNSNISFLFSVAQPNPVMTRTMTRPMVVTINLLRTPGIPAAPMTALMMIGGQR